MKKVLLVDESPLFRDYLRPKLERVGLSAVNATTAVEAVSKLRTELPDLIVMDAELNRGTAQEILRERNANPNARDKPVIITASAVDRETLAELASLNVQKILTKPVRIDELLDAVSAHTGVRIELDRSPGIIEVHVNEGVLFIEVAAGLNQDKIELLRYRIAELLALYKIRIPRVLLIMTSIDLAAGDSITLAALFQTILEASGAKQPHFKVLTASSVVRDFLSGRDDLAEIEIATDLEATLGGLLGRRAGSFRTEGEGVQQEFLHSDAVRDADVNAISLRFSTERAPGDAFGEDSGPFRVAVVDDDPLIRGLVEATFAGDSIRVDQYPDGRHYLDSPDAGNYGLVFLDLMMPGLDGFRVLQTMNERKLSVPVIVLSAITKRDAVITAMRLGVRSYLIKPLEPQDIRRKATEVLQRPL